MRMYIASLKIYVRALTVPSFFLCLFHILLLRRGLYWYTTHVYDMIKLSWYHIKYHFNLDIRNVTDFK